MVCHVHHVPGRLRLRLASLKRNEPAAQPLRLELLSIQGVNSVSINSITGSVTLRYDRTGFNCAVVWAALQRLGHIDQEPTETRHRNAKAVNPAAFPARELGLMFAKAATKALIDAALARSFGLAAGKLVRLLA